MPCVIVIISERQWSLRATHLACAMARSLGTGVKLVKMVAAPTPYHLGASYILPDENDPDMVALPELLATAEEYGVAAEVVYLHYASYVGGLASGAEQLEALAVFAPSPSRAPALPPLANGAGPDGSVLYIRPRPKSSATNHHR